MYSFVEKKCQNVQDSVIEVSESTCASKFDVLASLIQANQEILCRTIQVQQTEIKQLRNEACSQIEALRSEITKACTQIEAQRSEIAQESDKSEALNLRIQAQQAEIKTEIEALRSENIKIQEVATAKDHSKVLRMM